MESKEKQETYDNIFEKLNKRDYDKTINSEEWIAALLILFAICGNQDFESKYTLNDLEKRLSKLEGKIEVIEKFL